jgi:hypothetical protein
MWNSFKLMGEESKLASEAEKSIQQTFQELGNKPQLANKIIKFINSKSKEELRIHEVKDCTSLIMETEKIFDKEKFSPTSSK